MPAGMIMKGVGGFYYVAVQDKIYECRARGIFRKQEQTPLPGDRVIISILDEDKKTGSLEEILPRDNVLVRPAVANVDQLIAVISVQSPEPDLLLLDKLLVVAEQKGLDIVICINKIDLDTGRKHEKITDAYCKTGYTLVPTNSKTDAGCEKLNEVLRDRVSVLAGQSGVGKSTLLNRMMNAQVMRTGEVSEKLDRGKHTTRHAELLMLDTGGYLVDTPGFSSFELSEIPHDKLQLYYPDFSGHRAGCRFTGCSHVTEPGCCVKAAVEEGAIDRERYGRYVHLFELLKQNRSFRKK